jgi:peptide/nickel transport system substrate-binding protein
MPSGYLKQFHERYADKTTLHSQVKAARVKDWGSLHERMSRMYRPENPELPTLDPWRNMTPLPAEQFTFQRNPISTASTRMAGSCPISTRRR